MSRSVAARKRVGRRRPTHRAFALAFAIVLLIPFQSASAEDASPELIQPLICSAATVSDPRLKGLCEVTPRDDEPPYKEVLGDKVKVNLTVNTGPIEVGGYRVVTEHYNNSYLPPIVRARPGDAVAAQLVNLLAPRDRACEHEKAHKTLCEPCEHEKAHKLCEPCEHEKAHKSCENPTNLHYFHGGIVSPQNSRRDNMDAGAGKDPDNVTGDNVYVHLANGVDADGKARRFNFNVPIPGEGELDARVLEGEGMIAHPPGLNWYHSHLHGISSDQVMGGMSGLLSVGEDDANVKAKCREDPSYKDKCLNNVAQETLELKWKTEVRYALLRDISLRGIKEPPESANGASAIWAPEDRDFPPTKEVLPNGVERSIPKACPIWKKGSLEGDNNPELRKGYCQPEKNKAWLFTLNGQRFPTITVGGNRNLLLRLGNLSANVAYWLELRCETCEPKVLPLTILALDGVVPAKPVPADDAAKPVEAEEVDELLLMPASRAEIYVRNDDKLHKDEQVYILKTKGLDAGTDWWPEIQLARIVLKPNEIESPTVIGLNAPIEKVREAAFRAREAVSEEEKKLPPGCVRDLKMKENTARKEHRRVTFLKRRNPKFDTDWSIKTEIVHFPEDQTLPVDEQEFQSAGEATSIAQIPFEAYKNDGGTLDWEGKRNKHVCVELDAGGNSHKQLWVLFNNTDSLHNFHIHQMKFRLAKASELCERGIKPPLEAQTCPEPPQKCPDGSQTCPEKTCPQPNQKLYINNLDDPKKDSDGFQCPDPQKLAAIKVDKLSDREWHDTIPMPPDLKVFLIMSFDDPEQLGRFVFHCHILKHEDKGLMAPIEVWDSDDTENSGR